MDYVEWFSFIIKYIDKFRTQMVIVPLRVYLSSMSNQIFVRQSQIKSLCFFVIDNVLDLYSSNLFNEFINKIKKCLLIQKKN